MSSGCLLDALVCPLCRAGLDATEAEIVCTACRRAFPIVLGIPDLRLAPDPWLGIRDDREKAARLAERADSLTFAELLAFYWSITPDTAPRLARRFIEHALAGETLGLMRRRQIDLAPPIDVLDAGCGSGGLLVAAARGGDRAVGVDVALRWLVVARRRLEEAGVEARLVCANAQWLPFEDGSFDAVTGIGLLEHTTDRPLVVREAHRVLRQSGRALFTVTNRWAPTPEPHLQLWGVGYLPRRLGVAYARARRGVPYERVQPLGPPALRRLFRESPFGAGRMAADPIPPVEAGGPGRRWRPLVLLYELARAGPSTVRVALSWIAPVLCVRLTRRSPG